MKDMEKNYFWDNFDKHNIKNIQLLVSVGNPLLSVRLNRKIKSLCDTHSITKPVSVHVGGRTTLYNFDNHDEWDYYLTTMPDKFHTYG